jgi:hypothetical protein
VSAWQVSASYGQFWSHLHFTDGYEPTLNEQTVVGSAAYFWKNGWSLSLSTGAIVDGTITGTGPDYEIYPGWLVSARVAKEVLAERGAIPFIQVGMALSVSRVLAHREGQGTHPMWASDVQISATVGYTLFGFWRLYLAPRAFGGPVFLEHDGATVRGRDRYFFMAGMGMAFLLPAGFTIFVDGSPLGEQAISAGLAFAF